MEISVAALYRSIMTDVGCSAYDITYVLRRLAAEGIQFVTVTLPTLSKTILMGLETGYFDRKDLTSFRFKGSVLRLFESQLKLIFDESGNVLSPPSGAAVRTIRQVCEYCYKLALEYTEEQERKVIEAFVKNEEDLKELGTNPEVAHFSEQLRKDFETHYSKLACTSAHRILTDFRPRPTNGTFIGCDSDYYLERVSTRNSSYPSDCKAFQGYFKSYPGQTQIAMKNNGVKIVDNKAIQSRVPTRMYEQRATHEGNFSELLMVPKDSRGPRTICREAIKRVETQMSFFDFMIGNLTQISNGAINFEKQEVNRLIAEESSVTRKHATLDLESASDRVSYSVVKTIFRNSPGLRWFITGSRRATSVKIPGIGMKHLYKLSGMGSGLTFPTMSLIISLAICNRVSKRYTNLSYADIRKNVFVYGDDICVPRNWYAIAIESLAMIGLKVNVSKSFVHGYFRESCGADFVNGFDVTPVRLKLSNSKPVMDIESGRIKLADGANSFKQLYEHAKQLHKAGLTLTCKYVMSVLDQCYRTAFGMSMPAGAFDDMSDLPLNFCKGTDHYRVDEDIVIYAMRPVKRQVRDFLVSKNGHILERDPYNYLGAFLSVTKDDTTYQDHLRGLAKLAIDRTDPAQPSRFGEITVPRCLTFVKTKVRAEYIVGNFVPLTREQVQDNLNRERFMTDMAALSVAMLFDKAYL